MNNGFELLREEDLDREFITKVKAYPGAENIEGCIQCGTCTGSCQTSYEMDYTPRKIIAMIKAGMKKEVLTSKAIWHCASCYSCTVRCPKGIKITELMYALKSVSLREGYSLPKEESPAFYTSFYHIIEKYGRMHEASLILEYGLKTNPLSLVGMAPMGIKMLSKGKLELLPHKLKSINEIKSLIKYVREMEVS